jgi:hypothetical protein
VKTYRAHNCARAHRSAATFARCVWSKAHWVSGYTYGEFATVARCRGVTVTLWATPEEAHTAKSAIDGTGCGGRCIGRHEVIRLELPTSRQAAA